jgi:hypothetical protein
MTGVGNPERVSDMGKRFSADLPELTNEQRSSLIQCALRSLALKEAVEARKIKRKHAGRKPNYAIALLLTDIVVSGLADSSDLDRLASGSYWEERPRLADAKNEKINRLERFARVALGELGISALSLQTQARKSKIFLNKNNMLYNFKLL